MSTISRSLDINGFSESKSEKVTEGLGGVSEDGNGSAVLAAAASFDRLTIFNAWVI